MHFRVGHISEIIVKCIAELPLIGYLIIFIHTFCYVGCVFLFESIVLIPFRVAFTLPRLVVK